MTQHPPPSSISDPAAPQGSGAAEHVSPLVRRAVAPNPGPFTYTGTCSYILGHREVAIVDPGPADPDHIAALQRAIAQESLRYILVTHTHLDHSPAAKILSERTGAAIAGCAPHTRASGSASVAMKNLDGAHDSSYSPDIVMRDGETLVCGDLHIEAIATPGHCANHLSFGLLEDQALFTGDHVMAWATTVIAPPDGSMRDYLASLNRLAARKDRIYWPAHGGPVRDPQRYVRALHHHRRQRENAILERLAKGDETIPIIVARIYEGVDARLHGAAAMSVLAHLHELIERGEAGSDGPPTLNAKYFRT